MAFQITEEDVCSRLGPKEAFAAVKQAHLALEHGTAVNIVRTRARVPTGIIHTMSAASTELGLGCAKVYASGNSGFHSHILLYDLQSTKLLGLIEANELGRLRTAAASSLAANTLFTGKNPSLSIFGTGYQAQGILESFSVFFSLSHVSIYSPRGEHRKDFIAKMREKIDVDILDASEPKELLNSDIVVTATTSRLPVFNSEDLGEVKHISAIGSNSLARHEIPPRVITRARTITVDSLDAAREEGGNFLLPIEQGKLNWHQIFELGDLLKNKNSSSSEGGYTIYCSHGLAVQDLYLAARLL